MSRHHVKDKTVVIENRSIDTMFTHTGIQAQQKARRHRFAAVPQILVFQRLR
jgi:hypothetical protein